MAAKHGFLLVAGGGSGEKTANGLIVPRFGNEPENHVAVSLGFAALCELVDQNAPPGTADRAAPGGGEQIIKI
ncbi:MAG TPA: hypothetical protein IAD43_06415 [Candidatus Scatomorpha pullicola]|nr:hypothetical protein [Candidatus Scatomorpha pullicola]